MKSDLQQSIFYPFITIASTTYIQIFLNAILLENTTTKFTLVFKSSSSDKSFCWWYLF